MSADRPLIKPEKLKSKSYPSTKELEALGIELVGLQISEESRAIFARLAVLTPEQRLAKNISTLIALMCKSPVYNILTEGLTPEEHAALVELDLHVASLSVRETAHGLLNVHERWCAAKELRRLFKQAALSDGGYLVPESVEDE